MTVAMIDAEQIMPCEVDETRIAPHIAMKGDLKPHNIAPSQQLALEECSVATKPRSAHQVLVGWDVCSQSSEDLEPNSRPSYSSDRTERRKRKVVRVQGCIPWPLDAAASFHMHLKRTCIRHRAVP
jgi:hypothetical protein